MMIYMLFLLLLAGCVETGYQPTYIISHDEEVELSQDRKISQEESIPGEEPKR